jgi:hypothetical protein
VQKQSVQKHSVQQHSALVGYSRFLGILLVILLAIIIGQYERTLGNGSYTDKWGRVFLVHSLERNYEPTPSDLDFMDKCLKTQEPDLGLLFDTVVVKIEGSFLKRRMQLFLLQQKKDNVGGEGSSTIVYCK